VSTKKPNPIIKGLSPRVRLFNTDLGDGQGGGLGPKFWQGPDHGYKIFTSALHNCSLYIWVELFGGGETFKSALFSTSKSHYRVCFFLRGKEKTVNLGGGR